MIDSKTLVDTASKISRLVLGSTPKTVKYEPRGVMTHKYMVEMLNGDKYVIRIYPLNRSHVVNFEPDLMRAALNHGALVPRVVVDSRAEPSGSMAYMMYRMIDGENLSQAWPLLSSQNKSRLVDQVIENINTIFSIPVSGYGPLRTASEARHSTWQEFLTTTLEKGIQAAAAMPFLSNSLLPKIEALAGCIEEFPKCNGPAIIWSDISPDNIIVSRNGELKGFIDFEGALSGDRMMTFGYLFSKCFGTEFSDLIINAKQNKLDQRSLLKIYIFAVLRGLRLMPHLHQSLPAGGERSPLKVVLPGFEPSLDRLLENK